MTNKEAIDTIKTAIAQVEWDYPMDYAVAFDKAIEALEKQEPEKPIRKQIVNEYEKYTEYINRAFCAKCGAEFILRVNYCSCCGKAVKWV